MVALWCPHVASVAQPLLPMGPAPPGGGFDIEDAEDVLAATQEKGLGEASEAGSAAAMAAVMVVDWAVGAAADLGTGLTADAEDVLSAAQVVELAYCCDGRALGISSVPSLTSVLPLY